MDCKHVDTLLMDYLYQELDPTQAEQFEAHLQVCTRCAGELSAYERTRATMRSLPELEPPSRIDEVLLREAAKAVRLQPEPAPGFWQRVRESLRVMVLHPAMTAAVTLVVVLGVSFYIYRNSEPPSSGPVIEPTPGPVETGSATEAARPTPPLAAVPQAGEGEEKRRESTEDKLAKLEARLARDQAESQSQAGLRRGQRLSAGQGSDRQDVYGRMGVTRQLKPKAVAAGPAARASTGSGYGNAAPAEEMEKKGEALSGLYAKESAPKRARKATVAKAEPRPEPKVAAAPPVAEPPKVAAATPHAAPSKAPVYKKRAPTTEYKKLPSTSLGKSAGVGKSAADDVDALADGAYADERAPKGKGKLGQASGGGGKQVVLSGKLAGAQAGKDAKELSAEQWMHQGMIAQKLGKCSQALVYYDRALAVDPKLAGKLSSLVRSCAATLNETALAEARKGHPRLSGLLGLEVARRARLRTLDAESVATKRKAKAAAKPAKVNANVNKGDNTAAEKKATEAAH